MGARKVVFGTFIVRAFLFSVERVKKPDDHLSLQEDEGRSRLCSWLEEI